MLSNDELHFRIWYCGDECYCTQARVYIRRKNQNDCCKITRDWDRYKIIDLWSGTYYGDSAYIDESTGMTGHNSSCLELKKIMDYFHIMKKNNDLSTVVTYEEFKAANPNIKDIEGTIKNFKLGDISENIKE